MRKIFACILISIVFAGCAVGPVMRHPVQSDVPQMSFNDAKRQVIALLKEANLEKSGFFAATMKSAFKFKVREEGIEFVYDRYRGLLSDQTVTTTTSCDFEYLGDLFVVEYGSDRAISFRFEVPLGNSCDDLGVYFSTKERTIGFANALYALKHSALAELDAKKTTGKTQTSQGISKEELTTIVQTAVEKAKAGGKETKSPAIQSDIDKPSFNPSQQIMGDNDLAVIIGIEGYQSLPKSDFSYDDAKLVKEYVKALGFKERNIELLTDEKATKSSIEKSLEAWLKNKAKADSKVFVYYSGHGAPDPQTGEAYLVPYDGDPNYLEVTGYPLKRLYDKLGKLQVAEVIVLLDSCFSGAGGRSVLAKGARPLVMVTTSAVIPQNMAVLSATQGTQISTSSPEKGHGVFTYYFLKALKDGKKDIAEIYSYIKPMVEDEAKQLNVQQSPSISPDVEKIKGRFGLRK
ncbi:MAG: caspase family protein [Thermodesulfovibrionales bacterium]|nr:caspase family protein [Thermodesulfovibrionales bacterium]